MAKPWAKSIGWPNWQGPNCQSLAKERRPLLLTGEMMYSWMFEKISSLRPFRGRGRGTCPLRPFRAILRSRRADIERDRCSAAVYVDDKYVDAELATATAEEVGIVQAWVTIEFKHDGAREPSAVFARLQQRCASVAVPLG
ncbi:hypothetical protein ACVIKO_006543 [Rhizobium ruizarguesonis]